MGEDVKHRLRGPGLSSLRLQEKKGLLSTRACGLACARACVHVWHGLISNVAPVPSAGQRGQ